MSLWDLTPTSAIGAFDVPAFESSVHSMKFSPDGTRLVAGTGEGISKVLDMTPEGGGEGLTTASTGAVAFGSNADLLAVGKQDGTVQILDTDTGAVIRTLGSDGAEPVIDVAFDRSGSTVATLRADGSVTVADATTGTERLEPKHLDEAHHVGLSPDGDLVVATNWDLTRIWDTSSGEQVKRIPAANYANAFSRDGRLFAATVNPDLQLGNEKIEVWEVDTWSKIGWIDSQSDLSGALTFDADGTRLYAGGYHGVLEVWDVSTWRRLPPLSGNPGRIWAMASTADGRRLVTGSARGVHVWNPSTGRALFRVTTVPASFYDRIALSPDGSKVVAQSQNGTVSVYFLDLNDLLDLARSRVDRTLTDEECRQYLHLEDCPAD